jgi:hypothetical protein
MLHGRKTTLSILISHYTPMYSFTSNVQVKLLYYVSLMFIMLVYIGVTIDGKVRWKSCRDKHPTRLINFIRVWGAVGNYIVKVPEIQKRK